VGLTVAIDARRYQRAAVFERSGQVVPYFVAELDHAKHLGPCAGAMLNSPHGSRAHRSHPEMAI
jgi:hypothetical protein